MLDIIAGKSALKTIEQHGFNQDLFSVFLGASGGPKWFSLFGLDKYVFGEFFKNRTEELYLIGSSAGAFRSACFAQNDPVAAISRMAESYSETIYSGEVDASEVSAKAIELLDYALGDNGVEEIIGNQVFKTHFLVNKANGFMQSDSKGLQLASLFKSYLLNRVDRKLLKSQFDRYVFHHPQSQLQINDPYGFNTQHVELTNENLKQALLASGSIPLVMEGINDIPGAPKGKYWDGGIIDYHFDFQISHNDKLVLYPHFNPEPKAGWFDKNLSRKVMNQHYDNVVMLVPSAEFIASLPYGKIPDRKDFETMDAETRIKYWKTVLAETEKLADSFDDFLSSQDLGKIRLFSQNFK
ncbi:patatin-like phospholipase family protein [Parashewanella curva]|uniref:Patatin-like phospholipase family protein n=1 Tax=Parashewanella curva TaxID=2338552 RepID=A0A3L8Q2P0_9GAMM|nr:patatin-like phospholipase family protein [Parashewanella curva]RLV61163.1 patatin-like phospholipase family protein [Parashewanella curva]